MSSYYYNRLLCIAVIFTFAAFVVLPICYRCLAAHGTSAAETAEEKTLQEPKSSSEQSGWFSRFYRDAGIDTGHEQHSSRLSDKDTVYEIQCNYWQFV